MRGGKQDEQEIVEETADLLAHCGVLLILESIEEGGDDRGTQVGGELALYFLLQVLDFAIVEEVQS